MSSKLPIHPPFLPMEAKSVEEIPVGLNWQYEPKWDGFRCVAFRDGDSIELQSKSGQPLGRYFPELTAPILAQLPQKCVLDGKVVITKGEGLDFEALQLRLHPAASRVKMLSEQIPARIVFWDLLCEGDRDLRGVPFRERRAELEKVLADVAPPLHLTPLTADRATAEDWFRRFEGAGLDGVMAKLTDGIYEPNKRVMLKVKHERECDCVVGGFRWHKRGEKSAVGSLLLGLYGDDGALHHVGVAASFTDKKRLELASFLAPYRENALEGHPWKEWAEHMSGEGPAQRMPGGKSRWSADKDLSWEPLRAELVVEVAYDHMQGSRFRHTAQFRRWRPDKPPKDCTYAQLEVVAPQEVAEIFAGR